MRVALVGPPLSGKSTLFAAVAEAGGSSVDLHRPDQPHLATVKVPDPRLGRLAQDYHRTKIVPAEIEFLDLPGFDLSSESGRDRAKAHWASMRQSEMLVLVVRAFEDASVPPWRDRIDPAADVEELRQEMLFADLDQANTRAERLEQSLRKPTGRQEEQRRELELMRRLVAALEAERPVAEEVSSPAEEKLLRSFAFVSLKPALVALNCGESDLTGDRPECVGPFDCIRLSARIEEEIARLDPSEREEFLADLGVSAAARDRLIRACYAKMNLVSFLTIGPDECRAWTVPAGTEAVEAAGQIHTDIARGFIRAETVSYDDYVATGDMKAAKAAGKVRLEGKTYVVRDGDIINFRFNV